MLVEEHLGDSRTILVVALALLVGVPSLVVALIFLTRPAWKGLNRAAAHVGIFLVRETGDVVRIFGALLTSVVLVPIAVGNLFLGRLSSASHYGRAIQAEMLALVGSIYRVLVGNPARLLLLDSLTEGLEKRVPAAIAHAPGPTAPSGRQTQFEGYTIVGSLPGGGSGAKLYIADPSAKKIAALAREGQREVARVVIKSFSLGEGSTLAQIVRENRALPAAKRLGLILEHELTEEKFYYVTRYVPGESLVLTTQRLHAISGVGTEGLGDGARLKEAIEYASDILRTLSRYHSGGLWHKDVKPDNIIVHDGKAELVDFGLVTPLRSSMTLTTHGTEYFRDPEMVRMALRGVRVHEVDGAKFDIYAAGAVLYSMIENSFPAHGGLSRISKNCPEALRWVVRRAMTDYDKRYETAAMMLADVETVAVAPDPFALRPAELPSVIADKEGGIEPSSRVLPVSSPDMDEVGAPRVGASVRNATNVVGALASGENETSKAPEPEFPQPAVAEDTAIENPITGMVAGSSIRVVNWWTGKYAAEPDPWESGALPEFDLAKKFGEARVRAKALRKGRPVRLRRRRRGLGLSTGARIGIAVGAVALVANLGWFSKNSSGQTHVERAISVVQQTLGLRGAPEDISSGKAIVLWDGSGFDAKAQRQMNERLDRLSKAGFELVGTTAAAENAKKAAMEAEAIDGLREQIGAQSFRSEAAAKTVRGWLDEHQDLTMVIWIHANNFNEPDAWMIFGAMTSIETTRVVNRAMLGRG
jgi:serine/threonine protein kinase